MIGRRPDPPYKLLSALLRYPDRLLLEAGDEIAAAIAELPDPAIRDRLNRFAAHLAGHDQTELAQIYVATFDLNRRTSLYLGYALHGDTRLRGMALLRLRRSYQAAGLVETTGELPDHLPLMLEFAALAADGRGAELLAEQRPALELLRSGLHDAGSPYAELLDVLCTMLPRMTAGQRARLRAMSSDGPPEERVGLEPFAPPEVMPGSRV